MIVAANVPVYQRDDWRGVAHALAKPASTRLIVAEAHALLPLSIYLETLRNVSSPLPSVREVDFVALRHLRTVGPPQAAVVPLSAPPGFRAAGVTRTETFAISRFVATRPTSPRFSELAVASGIGNAEAILQR
jgi:hypothetical protein